VMGETGEGTTPCLHGICWNTDQRRNETRLTSHDREVHEFSYCFRERVGYRPGLLWNPQPSLGGSLEGNGAAIVRY
jgi:hypothetical protein